MPATAPPTRLARLYAEAWIAGETEAYVRAYYSVHETLRQSSRNTNLLVQVVNTLLSRMERDGLTAVQAARATLPTLDSEGGKLMVMAATIDIACNNYKPGQEVSSLRTPVELLG